MINFKEFWWIIVVDVIGYLIICFGILVFGFNFDNFIFNSFCF